MEHRPGTPTPPVSAASAVSLRGHEGPGPSGDASAHRPSALQKPHNEPPCAARHGAALRVTISLILHHVRPIKHFILQVENWSSFVQWSSRNSSDGQPPTRVANSPRALFPSLSQVRSEPASPTPQVAEPLCPTTSVWQSSAKRARPGLAWPGEHPESP